MNQNKAKLSRLKHLHMQCINNQSFLMSKKLWGNWNKYFSLMGFGWQIMRTNQCKCKSYLLHYIYYSHLHLLAERAKPLSCLLQDV